MKEALKVILSAWAIAFITLFLGWLVYCDHGKDYGEVPFYLFVGAVTGAGWLCYRWQSKPSH